MQKTGERYAAARMALLQQQVAAPWPKGAVVVPGYPLLPGVHGDTARLTAAMAQGGVLDPASGRPFAETAVFGLSGGVGFMYFLFEYKGFPPLMSFYCRSWSLPWPMLERMLAHAGVVHEVVETSSAKAAEKALDAALDTGKTAHLTLDAAALPWSGMDRMWLGQMPRQLNVIGRLGDDYVVDGGAVAVMPRAALAAARASVKKDKQRLVTFTPGAARTRPFDAVRQAAAHTVRTLRESPFKGFKGNFGLNGMHKAAKLMADAKDPKGWAKVFGSGELAFRALYRTWECAMVDLTPPAGGRLFFAEYLEAAAKLPRLGGLADAAALARQSGAGFEALADAAVAAGGDAMVRAVELSEQIDELRSTCGDVGAEVQALRAEREALGEGLDLDAAARAAAYAQLGEIMAGIAAVEEQLAGALERVMA